MRGQRETHFDPASWLQGQQHAELSGRVSELEEWRERLEGYAEIGLTNLRRVAIVLAWWVLAVASSALPGSPLAPITAFIGEHLIGH